MIKTGKQSYVPHTEAWELYRHLDLYIIAHQTCRNNKSRLWTDFPMTIIGIQDGGLFQIFSKWLIMLQRLFYPRDKYPHLCSIQSSNQHVRLSDFHSVIG